MRHCSVVGCGRPAKGPRAELCNLHDLRMRRYGDVHTVLQIRDGRSKHPLHMT